jgi:hypothetical protein
LPFHTPCHITPLIADIDIIDYWCHYWYWHIDIDYYYAITLRHDIAITPLMILIIDMPLLLLLIIIDFHYWLLIIIITPFSCRRLFWLFSILRHYFIIFDYCRHYAADTPHYYWLLIDAVTYWLFH